MENVLENLNLFVEEDDELVIGEVGLEGNSGTVEPCLVGQFLTNQTLNFSITKSKFASVWKPQRGVMFKEIEEGKIFIQFYHKLDLKYVINGRPWIIGSHPLILRHLKVCEIPHQVLLNSLPFWV
ncbi:hypothetical protein ACS0TY_015587 [Phlomoides rotata]